jgi:hypothetical protein
MLHSHAVTTFVSTPCRVESSIVAGLLNCNPTVLLTCHPHLSIIRTIHFDHAAPHMDSSPATSRLAIISAGKYHMFWWKGIYAVRNLSVFVKSIHRTLKNPVSNHGSCYRGVGLHFEVNFLRRRRSHTVTFWPCISLSLLVIATRSWFTIQGPQGHPNASRGDQKMGITRLIR